MVEVPPHSCQLFLIFFFPFSSRFFSGFFSTEMKHILSAGCMKTFQKKFLLFFKNKTNAVCWMHGKNNNNHL
jgi:hypothetical protein